MSKISFEQCIDFYNENKDKILIPEEKRGIYNINKQNVDKWLAKIDNADMKLIFDKENKYKGDLINPYPDTYEGHEKVRSMIKKFSKKIIDNMRYVNFYELIDRIKRIASEIYDKIRIYDQVHFIVVDNIYKSNTWILLLFIHCLMEIINSYDRDNLSYYNKKIVIFSDAEKSIIHHIKKYNDKKTLAIYFDDMSYSGVQIHTYLRKSAAYRKKSVEYDLYLGVAFISEYAINNINSLFIDHSHKIKLFENTEIIKPFYKIMMEDPNNDEEFKNFINRECKIDTSSIDFTSLKYGCYRAICSIYFDHKLADFLSTFTRILSNGSNIIDDENIRLINNCEDIDVDKTCPPAFYKSIIYTYNGNILEEDNLCILIDKIDRQRTYDLVLSLLKNINSSNDINTPYKNYNDHNDEIYNKKYLKYKQKYLNLKKNIKLTCF